MHQQIEIVGNLGDSPTMRYTPSGVAVTSFSVAVNESWTDKDGQKHDKVVWFRVSTWRNLAETCSKFLEKGRQVFVIGKMEEPRVWTDKQGNNRASLECTASRVIFLGNRGESGPSDSGDSGTDFSMEDTSEIPF